MDSMHHRAEPTLSHPRHLWVSQVCSIENVVPHAVIQLDTVNEFGMNDVVDHGLRLAPLTRIQSVSKLGSIPLRKIRETDR